MATEQQTSAELRAQLQGGRLAGSWRLDPSRSQVRLKSRSVWGLVPVTGVFRVISGNADVSPAGEVTGTIVVAARSVDTNNEKRDVHLRSADFFDVENHPDITFTVDSVRSDNGGGEVPGSLTVRGRTRPASFGVKASGTDRDVTLDGELQVNRADFGLMWNRIGMASMDNTITVHAVFTRQ